MASKRRDNKGRILRDGESQRKDGRYQYRYTDVRGSRKTIYSMDLGELRKKEAEIAKKQLNGIDYTGGQISVIDLVERYINIKKDGVKYNTSIIYEKVLKKLHNYNFGYQMISSIKASDVKEWFKLLNKEGLKRSSISQIRGILKPAFETAVQDDILHKNPLQFKLDFLGETSSPREALSPEELNKFLTFVASDKFAKKYLDIYLILVGTGMRVGELSGLTLRDVDMANHQIIVSHQLNRKQGGGVHIMKPKSKAGTRIIPMSNEVYESFRRIIANRPKLVVEPMVDGYSGFLFVSERGTIMINTYISKAIWSAIKRYNRTHKDDPLPLFSPHNLRHTFCTNTIDAGVNIKAVQYMMGHSKASITLDTYTHTSYRKVEAALKNATENSPLFDTTFTPFLHQNAVER